MHNWIQIPLDNSWWSMNGMGLLRSEAVKFLKWYKASFWICRDLIILSIIHIMVIPIFWISCLIEFALSPRLLWEIWYSTGPIWIIITMIKQTEEYTYVRKLLPLTKQLKGSNLSLLASSSTLKKLLLLSDCLSNRMFGRAEFLQVEPPGRPLYYWLIPFGVAIKSMEYWVFELRPSILTLETLLCKSSSSDGILSFLVPILSTAYRKFPVESALGVCTDRSSFEFSMVINFDAG